MNINRPIGYPSSVISQLTGMRRDMEDLSRQLGTGLKATSYGGLGAGRSLAISFRSKLETTQTYQQSIDVVALRLKSTTQTLTHMQSVVDETRKSFDPNRFDLLADGVTGQQKTAVSAMVEFLGLLDSEVAGRYSFGGRETNEAPVESYEHIMNGDAGRAGFRQILDERRQADLGTGTGRLTVGAAGPVATIAEDGTHPFGFKLQPAQSTLSNATVTAPSGSPPSMSVTFSAQPKAGESLTVTLDMPDGTRTTVKVVAGDTQDPAKGLFQIGATPDDTAANLVATLSDRIGFAAETELTAASAVAASGNFFDTRNGQPPQRVAGPPFASATAMTAGTTTDTVFWYKGENTAMPTGSPRGDVQAMVDTNVSVSYGMRANEEAFTWNIRQFAVMATADLSAGDAAAKGLHQSLAIKLKGNLASPEGKQSLTAVHMEIALAQTATEQAKERHTQSAGTLKGYLSDLEGVDDNEVSVQLLALQTNMQATYQASSMLFKMSLTNFL